MARDSGSRFDLRRCAKPTGLAATIVIFIGVLLVLPDLFETLPRAVRELYIERFLWTMLIVYWSALILGVVGGAILGILLFRARRAGRRRPIAARLLLLGVAGLLGLAMMEAGSAVWLAWAHRFPRLPTRLPGSPGNSLRIAVVGGSSAWGQPYQDWLSIGPIVAWKLQPELGGRRVIVQVLARPGATLEDMHHELEHFEHRPDVLIIYSGHNEFQSRYPWDRDADRVGGPASLSWMLVMGQGVGSPFCRLVSEAFSKYRLMLPPRIDRHGLIDPPIVRRAEFEEVRDTFGRRLEAIVSCCERIGTMPVLVIPPGNEAGFEPNRSVLPGSATEAERRAFARDFRAARAFESDPPRAMRQFLTLLARQPGFAEAHFRLARLLERSGRYDEANRHYILARDLDGFPQRCPTSFQDCYRRVAARHGCILIDGLAELRAISPHGILDDHLFNDGHHPSLRGHVALAEAVLRALRARKAFGWSRGPAPSIDPAECAAHFGIDEKVWVTVCSRAAGFYRITAGNRYDPSERLDKAGLYDRAAERIAAGTASRDIGLPGVGLGPARNAEGEDRSPVAVCDPPASPRGRIASSPAARP